MSDRDIDPNIDKFIESDGIDTQREKEIGLHIGYRYDVNLVPDMSRVTPFLEKYMAVMGWQDLNWLEDVHMGYEEGRPAVFDRNINGWVTVPKDMKLPDNQQDRDMIARELLVKFQMSSNHPMVELRRAYEKFSYGVRSREQVRSHMLRFIAELNEACGSEFIRDKLD